MLRLVSIGLVGVASADVLPIVGTPYGFEWVKNLTNITHPGYAFLPKELPGQLVLNRFGATPFFGKSYVSLVDVNTGAVDDLATNIDWPNVATTVDASVFGFTAIIVGSGFLVPTHTTGGIWVLEASASPTTLKQPVKITKDIKSWKPESGWFYHVAEVVDMNNDGLADIVTSRCADSVLPASVDPKKGKLVWLEQPKENAFDGTPWIEHQIQDGPDFLFARSPKSTPTNFQACSAEFIGEQLTYVHGDASTGVYSTRVVDDELGPGFGCSWVDLNGDGNLDLMATNHVNQNGKVTAYTWEGDLADNATKVTKYTLASNFSAVSDKTGQAAPGDAIAFFVEPAKTTGKPLVLVSEDNGNAIFILVPASVDPDNWDYHKQELSFIGADVGRIAIGDTDNDGFNELFVPAYDLDQLVHFKFVNI